jgi:ABC-2 type transport system ATP-binding protein
MNAVCAKWPGASFAISPRATASASVWPRRCSEILRCWCSMIHDIREVIKNMAGRRTVILSTHILPEVSMTCQKVIIINRGRIEAQGTPEHLVSSFAGGTAIMVTAEGPTAAIQELLGRVPGVGRVTLERAQGTQANVYRVEISGGANPRAEIARALVQAGYPLLELTSIGLSLEDIFLSVISSQGEAA